MIKKVTGALIGLCFTSCLSAAYPEMDMLPPAPPFVAVTIPQQLGSFTLGAEGIYQQALNGNYQFATLANIGTIFTTTSINSNADAKVQSLQPDHHLGWALDTTYHFPGNGQDIQFAWAHFHHRDSETQLPGNSVLLGSSIFTPTVFTGTFVNGWNSVKATSRNNYDALDFVFGQKMEFGKHVTLRTFGGLRYAAINLKDDATYLAAVNDGLGGIDSAQLINSYKSKFQGIGGRGGIDASIRLGRNLSIVGRFAGSLLGGNFDQKLKLNSIAIDASVPARIIAEIPRFDVDGSQTSIIPELDARIGLDYLYPVTPGLAFNIQIGYDVTNYFDVKQTSILSYVDSVRHANDFAIQGPYFRLQMHLI